MIMIKYYNDDDYEYISDENIFWLNFSWIHYESSLYPHTFLLFPPAFFSYRFCPISPCLVFLSFRSTARYCPLVHPAFGSFQPDSRWVRCSSLFALVATFQSLPCCGRRMITPLFIRFWLRWVGFFLKVICWVFNTRVRSPSCLFWFFQQLRRNWRSGWSRGRS